MQDRTREKDKSTNIENIRVRFEKIDQLQVPVDNGGEDWRYGYGDKT